MAHSILLLPGDGIGPEIMGPVGSLLERIGVVTGQPLTLETALVGGCAIDAEGTPRPQPRWRQLGRPTRSSWARWAGRSGMRCRRRNVRAGLLGLRSGLGLFANLRPTILFPSWRRRRRSKLNWWRASTS